MAAAAAATSWAQPACQPVYALIFCTPAAAQDSYETESRSSCRLHPHHHGSSSNQLGTASLPIVVEPSSQGHDFWSDASCAAHKAAYLGGAQEIILHFQVASDCVASGAHAGASMPAAVGTCSRCDVASSRQTCWSRLLERCIMRSTQGGLPWGRSGDHLALPGSF